MRYLSPAYEDLGLCDPDTLSNEEVLVLQISTSVLTRIQLLEFRLWNSGIKTRGNKVFEEQNPRRLGSIPTWLDYPWWRSLSCSG